MLINEAAATGQHPKHRGSSTWRACCLPCSHRHDSPPANPTAPSFGESVAFAWYQDCPTLLDFTSLPPTTRTPTLYTRLTLCGVGRGLLGIDIPLPSRLAVLLHFLAAHHTPLESQWSGGLGLQRDIDDPPILDTRNREPSHTAAATSA